MRQAFREGRNTSVKGSSAAMRIYGQRNSEYGLEIPASIQAMMAKDDQPDLTIDDHLDHLSFQDPNSDASNPPRNITSHSQWTHEQNERSAEQESDPANAARPASAHASSRTSGSPQQSGRVSPAGARSASAKSHSRPGTGQNTFHFAAVLPLPLLLAPLTTLSADLCSSCKAGNNRHSGVHGPSRNANCGRQQFIINPGRKCSLTASLAGDPCGASKRIIDTPRLILRIGIKDDEQELVECLCAIEHPSSCGHNLQTPHGFVGCTKFCNAQAFGNESHSNPNFFVDTSSGSNSLVRPSFIAGQRFYVYEKYAKS